MNGRKKLKREHAKRFDVQGLPVNPNEWTVADWMDLHRAMQEVVIKVSKRHAKEQRASATET